MKKSGWTAAALAAALLTGSGLAHAQSAAINFSIIADAPTSGTLANGVAWNVTGAGHWESITTAGTAITYTHYTLNDNLQTWTFSVPVNLSFTVRGLNCLDEGIKFGGGAPAVAVSISAVHNWDATAQTVVHTGAANDGDAPEQSSFTMSNTQSLTLTGTGVSACRRGLMAMTVTPVAATANTAVPVNNPWALLALAVGMTSLSAMLLRRRRAR